MMDVLIDVDIMNHESGNEYCIVDAHITNFKEFHHTKFSFYLKYLFEQVLPEHRVWFFDQIVCNQIKKELATTLDLNFVVNNIEEKIAECEKIFAIKS